MGRDLVGTLRALRGDAVSRLMHIRATIDPVYERVSEADALEQFGALLAHFETWAGAGDRAAYEDAIGRWAAMRFGEGFGAETVVNALVASGDVVARIAHDRLESDDAVAVSRVAIDASFVASRLVTGALADELSSRRGQLRGLRR